MPIVQDGNGRAYMIPRKPELSDVKLPQLPANTTEFRNWIMAVAKAVKTTFHHPDQGAYN